MNNIFVVCELLNEVNFSIFNTNNAIFMNHICSSCFSFININLKKLNNINVFNIKEMFSNFISLKYLYLFILKMIMLLI